MTPLPKIPRPIIWTVLGIVLMIIFLICRWMSLPEVNPVSKKPTPLPPEVRMTGSSGLIDLKNSPLGEGSKNSDQKNAAFFYRLAFDLYAKLSDEEKTILRGKWKKEVSPEVSAALGEKLKPICDLIEQASHLHECDWGREKMEFTSPRPELSASLDISRALVWNAAHCRVGDPAGAVGDLTGALALGQRLESSMIDHLVNTSIQGLAVEFIAERAVSQGLTADPRLINAFENPRYEEGIYRALEGEVEMLIQATSKIRAGGPEATELLKLVNESKIGDSKIIGMMEESAGIIRELIVVLEKPDADFQKWLDAKKKLVEKGNIILPSLEDNIEKTRSAVIRRSIAEAGLAVINKGSSALLSYPDPATGKPFIYRQTDTGFDLESSYQYKNAPVKVSFQTP